MPSRSLEEAYFERLYAAADDPWNFRTSRYEREKYAATLAALGERRFARVFEIGCSIGELTALLAPRCNALLAVDISERAVVLARRRCSAHANLRIVKMTFPSEFPPGRFDLVVLSEVGYYWSDCDLALAKNRIATIAAGGLLQLVHFLPKVDEYVRDGDSVHAALSGMSALRRLSRPVVNDSGSTCCALRTKDFSGVPAAARALRLTVTVPARNEQAAIERCLRAFAMQRTTCGRPLAAEVLDVVVYANSCGDGTAHVAARFVAAHPQLRAWVVASPLPSGDAHVGTARKTVMDFAASRFLRARSPRGLVASVDADTIVDPDWAARLLAAAERVDAVAGHVFIDALELATLPAGVRRLYALEATYRRLCAELEATIDPLLEDPAPRHDAFVGANFAVTAGTYVAAGGFRRFRASKIGHFFSRCVGLTRASGSHSTCERRRRVVVRRASRAASARSAASYTCAGCVARRSSSTIPGDSKKLPAPAPLCAGFGAVRAIAAMSR